MSTFEEIINTCKKEWACPDLMESVNKASGRKIPFSSPTLNWATYGGIPRNAITEFYGEPNGGKSTTAIDVCKNALDLFTEEYNQEVQELEEKASQKKEYKIQLTDLKDRGVKKILYVDLEHAFDRKWARTLGITNKSIDIMQPPDIAAELLLNKITSLIETDELGLVVLDSIPSLQPKAKLDKQLGERTVAALAGLMTDFCVRVIPLLRRYDCTMIFINQLRDNMDNPYVDQTPGGQAIKFYSSLRLSFKKDCPIDFLGGDLPQKAENPAGYKIKVTLKKQKSAPFDRKVATYFLLAQSGLRVDYEYADLAIKQYGIIIKGGAWFTICDPKTKEPLERDGTIVKINGLAKVYDFIQNNEDWYRETREVINANMTQVELDGFDDEDEETEVAEALPEYTK